MRLLLILVLATVNFGLINGQNVTWRGEKFRAFAAAFLNNYIKCIEGANSSAADFIKRYLPSETSGNGLSDTGSESAGDSVGEVGRSDSLGESSTTNGFTRSMGMTAGATRGAGGIGGLESGIEVNAPTSGRLGEDSRTLGGGLTSGTLLRNGPTGLADESPRNSPGYVTQPEHNEIVRGSPKRTSQSAGNFHRANGFGGIESDRKENMGLVGEYEGNAGETAKDIADDSHNIGGLRGFNEASIHDSDAQQGSYGGNAGDDHLYIGNARKAGNKGHSPAARGDRFDGQRSTTGPSMGAFDGKGKWAGGGDGGGDRPKVNAGAAGDNGKGAGKGDLDGKRSTTGTNAGELNAVRKSSGVGDLSRDNTGNTGDTESYASSSPSGKGTVDFRGHKGNAGSFDGGGVWLSGNAGMSGSNGNGADALSGDVGGKADSVRTEEGAGTNKGDRGNTEASGYRENNAGVDVNAFTKQRNIAFGGQENNNRADTGLGNWAIGNAGITGVKEKGADAGAGGGSGVRSWPRGNTRILGDKQDKAGARLGDSGGEGRQGIIGDKHDKVGARTGVFSAEGNRGRSPLIHTKNSNRGKGNAGMALDNRKGANEGLGGFGGKRPTTVTNTGEWDALGRSSGVGAWPRANTGITDYMGSDASSGPRGKGTAGFRGYGERSRGKVGKAAQTNADSFDGLAVNSAGGSDVDVWLSGNAAISGNNGNSGDAIAGNFGGKAGFGRKEDGAGTNKRDKGNTGATVYRENSAGVEVDGFGKQKNIAERGMMDFGGQEDNNRAEAGVKENGAGAGSGSGVRSLPRGNTRILGDKQDKAGARLGDSGGEGSQGISPLIRTKNSNRNKGNAGMALDNIKGANEGPGGFSGQKPTIVTNAGEWDALGISSGVGDWPRDNTGVTDYMGGDANGSLGGKGSAAFRGNGGRASKVARTNAGGFEELGVKYGGGSGADDWISGNAGISGNNANGGDAIAGNFGGKADSGRKEEGALTNKRGRGNTGATGYRENNAGVDVDAFGKKRNIAERGMTGFGGQEDNNRADAGDRARSNARISGVKENGTVAGAGGSFGVRSWPRSNTRIVGDEQDKDSALSGDLRGEGSRGRSPLVRAKNSYRGKGNAVMALHNGNNANKGASGFGGRKPTTVTNDGEWDALGRRSAVGDWPRDNTGMTDEMGSDANGSPGWKDTAGFLGNGGRASKAAQKKAGSFDELGVSYGGGSGPDDWISGNAGISGNNANGGDVIASDFGAQADSGTNKMGRGNTGATGYRENSVGVDMNAFGKQRNISERGVTGFGGQEDNNRADARFGDRARSNARISGVKENGAGVEGGSGARSWPKGIGIIGDKQNKDGARPGDFGGERSRGRSPGIVARKIHKAKGNARMAVDSGNGANGALGSFGGQRPTTVANASTFDVLGRSSGVDDWPRDNTGMTDDMGSDASAGTGGKGISGFRGHGGRARGKAARTNADSFDGLGVNYGGDSGANDWISGNEGISGKNAIGADAILGDFGGQAESGRKEDGAGANRRGWGNTRATGYRENSAGVDVDAFGKQRNIAERGMTGFGGQEDNNRADAGFGDRARSNARISGVKENGANAGGGSGVRSWPKGNRIIGEKQNKDDASPGDFGGERNRDRSPGIGAKNSHRGKGNAGTAVDNGNGANEGAGGLGGLRPTTVTNAGSFDALGRISRFGDWPRDNTGMTDDTESGANGSLGGKGTSGFRGHRGRARGKATRTNADSFDGLGVTYGGGSEPEDLVSGNAGISGNNGIGDDDIGFNENGADAGTGGISRVRSWPRGNTRIIGDKPYKYDARRGVFGGEGSRGKSPVMRAKNSYRGKGNAGMALDNGNYANGGPGGFGGQKPTTVTNAGEWDALRRSSGVGSWPRDNTGMTDDMGSEANGSPGGKGTAGFRSNGGRANEAAQKKARSFDELGVSYRGGSGPDNWISGKGWISGNNRNGGGTTLGGSGGQLDSGRREEGAGIKNRPRGISESAGNGGIQNRLRGIASPDGFAGQKGTGFGGQASQDDSIMTFGGNMSAAAEIGDWSRGNVGAAGVKEQGAGGVGHQGGSIEGGVGDRYVNIGDEGKAGDTGKGDSAVVGGFAGQTGTGIRDSGGYGSRGNAESAGSKRNNVEAGANGFDRQKNIVGTNEYSVPGVGGSYGVRGWTRDTAEIVRDRGSNVGAGLVVFEGQGGQGRSAGIRAKLGFWRKGNVGMAVDNGNVADVVMGGNGWKRFTSGTDIRNFGGERGAHSMGLRAIARMAAYNKNGIGSHLSGFGGQRGVGGTSMWAFGGHGSQKRNTRFNYKVDGVLEGNAMRGFGGPWRTFGRGMGDLGAQGGSTEAVFGFGGGPRGNTRIAAANGNGNSSGLKSYTRVTGGGQGASTARISTYSFDELGHNAGANSGRVRGRVVVSRGECNTTSCVTSRGREVMLFMLPVSMKYQGDPTDLQKLSETKTKRPANYYNIFKRLPN